jgi:hypothetical protein
MTEAPALPAAARGTRSGVVTAVIAAVGTASVATAVGILLEWVLRPDCEVPVLAQPTTVPKTGTSPDHGDEPDEPDGLGAGTSPCADVVGRWHFQTVTTWAKASYGFVGITASWELELEALDGCNVNATLSVAGNAIKRGSTQATVTPTADGGLRLVASFVLPKDDGTGVDGTRSYALTFAGGALEGGWRLHNTSGALLTFGVLGGGRRSSTTKPSADLQAYGCTTRCWALCGSKAAVEACTARNCQPRDTIVTDCGPPAKDLEVPGRAATNLAKGVDAVIAARVSKPGHCAAAADALRGTWSVWRADAAAPWTLTLDASGCALFGTVDGEAYEGTVDEIGAWIVRPVAAANEVWSLMGWGPAFGVGSSGKTIAAYKR